jgi:chromosomal replication initiation ATPase DnaA
MHVERKARLARLGSVPQQRAIQDMNGLIDEQRSLIDEISDSTDAMATWVKRQKAINFKLRVAVENSPDTRPSVSSIQVAVSNYFVIELHELLATCRVKEVAYARHVAMYLCRKLTLRSLPEIGRKFGNRDHTTIMHGVAKIKRLIRSDWEVAHDVAHVEALLS